MDKYLKRNAYENLLLWKKREHHATLEVSGARQVGKTYIVNKFADEQYQHKIYINLLDFTGELFLERYKELRNEILHGLQCANPVYELIKRAYVGGNGSDGADRSAGTASSDSFCRE